MEKLNDTYSICNICLKRIKAEVINKNGCVFIKKRCKKHGSFISPHVWDDLETYKYLIKFDKFKFPSRKILFNITNDCNLKCNFCYAKSNEIKIEELNLQKIKEFNLNNFDYIFLSGGEPTLKKDLFDIIKFLKKQKKHVFLLTNGLKLSKESYVKKLKESKVDMVILQFDSLKEEDIIYLRGIELQQIKLKVIKNLNKYKIPVYFFSIQIKKNNLENIRALIFYIKKFQNTIKGINFNTIWKIGRYEDKDWISTKEITKNCCKIMNIKKEDFLISTEFIYYFFILIAKMTNKRRYFSRCLLFLPAIFQKDNLIPITNIFDLKKITRYIKKIVVQKKYSAIFSLFFYLIFSQLIINLIKNKNFRIFLKETLKKIRLITHKNIFLLNPFVTFNIGEFPTAEDFDYNFVDTCNLLFYSPQRNQIPVCLNQIRFSHSNHPLYK